MSRGSEIFTIFAAFITLSQAFDLISWPELFHPIGEKDDVNAVTSGSE